MCSSKYEKDGLKIHVLGWFGIQGRSYLKAIVTTPLKARTDLINGDMLTYLLKEADKKCKAPDEKVYLHYAEIYYNLIK